MTENRGRRQPPVNSFKKETAGTGSVLFTTSLEDIMPRAPSLQPGLFLCLQVKTSCVSWLCMGDGSAPPVFFHRDDVMGSEISPQ